MQRTLESAWISLVLMLLLFGIVSTVEAGVSIPAPPPLGTFRVTDPAQGGQVVGQITLVTGPSFPTLDVGVCNLVLFGPPPEQHIGPMFKEGDTWLLPGGFLMEWSGNPKDPHWEIHEISDPNKQLRVDASAGGFPKGRP